MGMREKLIELCEGVILSCKASLCADCEHNHIDYPNCMGVHFADHLIANGVILDNQVSSSKWIPVSERLPDAETNVLVFIKGCDYASILTFRHDGYGNLEFMYQDDCGYWRKAFRSEVTHWMPLPEPPKEERQ